MTHPPSQLLSESPLHRLRRLADLACDELEDHLRRGEPCRSEDLLASYPELAVRQDFALELIRLEFSLRQQMGQAPSLDDFCSRFPQWSESLKDLLATLSGPATSGSAGQATLPVRCPFPEAARPRDVRRLLGHYELLERIGHGGMGDVYRARQCPPLERIVALKLLRTGDEFEVLTFEKEIEVARRLRHANLLPIFDAGCIDGEYFYTMPLLAGGSLLKRMGRDLPDRRWTVALIEKVARAVHCAHQRGVLHRDLKPANILLDDNDEPLVADFGLAKLLDRSLAQTQTGQLLGSVPYMSPEQARGEGHRATPASDVWSLGVILYEMLTGRRPFEGDSHSEVMKRIQRIEPFRPRQLQADLPPDLETICLKCLEKDPAWRYRSAEELADDLKHWLDGVPLPPEGLATRFRRVLPRSSGRWASIAVLALVLGLFLAAFLTPRASPPRPLPPQDRRASLLAEEARAAPDRPLLVFGPGQPLRWSRAEVGGERTKVFEKAGKPLTIETLSLCLLEVLPPNARRGGFRLTVVMRHEDMTVAGRVGVYLGRAPHVAAGRPGHTFVKLDFAEPHLRAMAGEDLSRVPPDQINRMGLGIAGLGEPANEPPRLFGFTKVFPSLPPGRAPNGDSLWRKLTVEMTPKLVREIDERQQRHELRRPDDLQAVFKILQRGKADLQNVAPDFPITGGIGIFVFGGSAQVRLDPFSTASRKPLTLAEECTMPKQQKKSPPARSANGRAKGTATRTKSRPAKRTRPTRQKVQAGFWGPQPLVQIVSVVPQNPVPVPGNLTVNASCRMGGNMTCAAYLLDTAAMPVDLGPTAGPGPNPNNPQFTFNLNMAGKTYALEVFIVDNNTGQSIASDGQIVMT